MKSSGNSSATARDDASLRPRSSTTHSQPPRRTFALTGRSVRLDPRVHAVRGDLADVRLADQVFAPHYAEAIGCRICWSTPLLDARGGVAVAELAKGATFELLELAAGHGWGIAKGAGPDGDLVGYVDRRALELA